MMHKEKTKYRNKTLQYSDWWKNVYDQPIKNNKITYENIAKISTSQRDDYTTGFLLDYTYFKDNYKMIAVDLSQQQTLDSERKAIRQIHFRKKLGKETQESISFLRKQKKLFWIFHK